MLKTLVTCAMDRNDIVSALPCYRKLLNVDALKIFTPVSHTDDCLSALYCAIVCPILEFASVLWTPTQQYVCSIETIQKTFLRALLYCLGLAIVLIPLIPHQGPAFRIGVFPI